MTLNRRGFLQISAAAGGGLALGFNLFACRDATAPATAPAAPGSATATAAAAPATSAELNAWIVIASDDTVTLRCHSSEMGQGVLVSFAQILADELHADWSKVRAEHGLADPRYGNQSTGGSNSIRGNFERLRQAGAAAREMLVAAGAARLGAAPGECRAENGFVVAPSGERVSFGAIAEDAAKLPAPEAPRLTDAKDLRFIGKSPLRLDTPGKIAGETEFGIDVVLDGMKIAVIARCPVFGGKLKRFDDAKARAVPGVRDVVAIDAGVAVIADHTWAAMQGRDALEIEWDEGEGAKLSSATIRQRALAALKQGKVARDDGGAPAALKKAKRTVEAVYEVPYLAHAAMEPLDATARIKDGRCEVWAGAQAQGSCRRTAAKITGLPEEQVVVHTAMLGGGFGRRSKIDFVAEAVELAHRTGLPIKVQWTREDDMTGGWYRPFAVSRLRAALDGKGAPVAWEHAIASPNILGQFGPLDGGIDRTSVEGAADLIYDIPALRVTYADVPLPITTWFWRSVGSSINAFATECFLDELARAGKQDPVALRRALLGDRARHRAVLDVAADKAGWGTPLPAGRARGVALQESFDSIVAQVAEVSIVEGRPKVHRVVCAIDPGQVVNPDQIAAQMESSVAFGLSAALFGAITIENGRVVEDNFDSYPVVRMKDMPVVETHIVASGAPHGGVGEPGVPPIAPAVANAVAALTGKPVRSLPIRLG